VLQKQAQQLPEAHLPRAPPHPPPLTMTTRRRWPLLRCFWRQRAACKGVGMDWWGRSWWLSCVCVGGAGGGGILRLVHQRRLRTSA
jgi:hypothetical protein